MNVLEGWSSSPTRRLNATAHIHHTARRRGGPAEQQPRRDAPQRASECVRGERSRRSGCCINVDPGGKNSAGSMAAMCGPSFALRPTQRTFRRGPSSQAYGQRNIGSIMSRAGLCPVVHSWVDLALCLRSSALDIAMLLAGHSRRQGGPHGTDIIKVLRHSSTALPVRSRVILGA
jgi:hypothetical protein